jgi:hypothetical protein
MALIHIWQEPLVLLNECLKTLEQSQDEYFKHSFTWKQHNRQIRKYKKAIKQLTK